MYEISVEQIRNVPFVLILIIAAATVGALVCNFLIRTTGMYGTSKFLEGGGGANGRAADEEELEENKRRAVKDLKSWRNIRDRMRREKRIEAAGDDVVFLSQHHRRRHQLQRFCLTLRSVTCVCVLLGALAYLLVPPPKPAPKTLLEWCKEKIASAVQSFRVKIFN